MRPKTYVKKPPRPRRFKSGRTLEQGSAPGVLEGDLLYVRADDVAAIREAVARSPELSSLDASVLALRVAGVLSYEVELFAATRVPLRGVVVDYELEPRASSVAPVPDLDPDETGESYDRAATGRRRSRTGNLWERHG